MQTTITNTQRKEAETALKKIHAAVNTNEYKTPALMSGNAGTALFNFHYNKYFYNDAMHNNFENQIQNIAAQLHCLNGIGLCNGRTGTDWFFYFLYKQELLEKDDLNFFCSSTNELAEYALQLANKNNFDYLHGSTGIAYYLLNNDLFNNQTFFQSVFTIIEKTIANNNYFNAIPEYDFVHDKINASSVNLGFAHGIASVLNFCIACYKKNVCKTESKIIADTLIEFYKTHINKKETISVFSNRINLENIETQSRLAWCYGDLMIGKTLLDASIVFDYNGLLNFALNILQQTTERITIEATNVHDACFCHGAAGIAYIYKKIYQQTNDKVFNEGSMFWLNKTLSTLKDDYKMYDALTSTFKENFSLIDGISGTGLVLYSFLSNNFDWDFCFMLNE